MQDISLFGDDDRGAAAAAAPAQAEVSACSCPINLPMTLQGYVLGIDFELCTAVIDKAKQELSTSQIERMKLELLAGHNMMAYRREFVKKMFHARGFQIQDDADESVLSVSTADFEALVVQLGEYENARAYITIGALDEVIGLASGSMAIAVLASRQQEGMVEDEVDESSVFEASRRNDVRVNIENQSFAAILSCIGEDWKRFFPHNIACWFENKEIKYPYARSFFGLSTEDPAIGMLRDVIETAYQHVISITEFTAEVTWRGCCFYLSQEAKDCSGFYDKVRRAHKGLVKPSLSALSLKANVLNELMYKIANPTSKREEAELGERAPLLSGPRTLYG